MPPSRNGAPGANAAAGDRSAPRSGCDLTAGHLEWPARQHGAARTSIRPGIPHPEREADTPAWLRPSVPPAGILLTGRGQDADRFGDALTRRGAAPCIPSGKGRRVATAHGTIRRRRRHRTGSMFGRLKGWRRVATRYDRGADLFPSACAFAAHSLFRPWVLGLA